MNTNGQKKGSTLKNTFVYYSTYAHNNGHKLQRYSRPIVTYRPGWSGVISVGLLVCLWLYWRRISRDSAYLTKWSSFFFFWYIELELVCL